MKKFLLGIFVIVMAVSFAAFKKNISEPKSVDLYWFQISNQHLPGAAVPQADAAFIQQSPTAPAGTGCTGTQTYDCVGGFAQSQVNTTTHQLINNSQVPQNVPHLKPN